MLAAIRARPTARCSLRSTQPILPAQPDRRKRRRRGTRLGYLLCAGNGARRADPECSDGSECTPRSFRAFPELSRQSIETLWRELVNRGKGLKGVLPLDWDEERNCAEAGCFVIGKCCCAKISNVRIGEINGLEMAASVVDQRVEPDEEGYSRRALETWAMERGLQHMKLGNDDFEIDVAGGFYGDEVTGVYLQPSAEEKVAALCRQIDDARSPSKLTKDILRREYGKLPQRVARFSFERRRVPTEAIVFPNDWHASRLDQRAVARYKSRAEEIKFFRRLTHRLPLAPEYEIPLGVVERRGERYLVLDGYHRLTAAKKARLKEVGVLVGERRS